VAKDPFKRCHVLAAAGNRQLLELGCQLEGNGLLRATIKLASKDAACNRFVLQFAYRHYLGPTSSVPRINFVAMKARSSDVVIGPSTFRVTF
jgi:hypothetical protein